MGQGGEPTLFSWSGWGGVILGFRQEGGELEGITHPLPQQSTRAGNLGDFHPPHLRPSPHAIDFTSLTVSPMIYHEYAHCLRASLVISHWILQQLPKWSPRLQRYLPWAYLHPAAQ